MNRYITKNWQILRKTRAYKVLIVLLVLWGFFVSPSSYADEKVHEYQLKNGLKLIVKEDHRAPAVVSQVWYKVGSSYEPLGITGISHALEHMMFRGSKKYGPNEFMQIIAENGGQQNAFTSYDYTGYYEVLSADKLPISFELEADRMRNLLLREQDFTNEIQVVMEERRMRTDDDPQQLTMERFNAAAHVANSYHHPVIGWMGDLKKMTVKDLRSWYETWYAPNNAIVVVVGDVNPQSVYLLAQKYFGNLKAAQLPIVKPEQEVASLGMRTVVVEAPAKLPWLVMGYNTPVLNSTAQKWQPYALWVLANILAGSDSSRLQQNLVRGKQIATEIDIGYDPFDRMENTLVMQVTPAQGHSVAENQQAILQEIKKIQDQLVTPEELQRVKAQLIANKVYERDSISSQANEIGSLEVVGLSWREADNALKQIQAITPEQVQAVAREYLITNNLTIAELKPLPLTGKPIQQTTPALGEEHVR